MTERTPQVRSVPPPPAPGPVLVEDPPSSDEGDTCRRYFKGSSGLSLARSAPSTPLGDRLPHSLGSPTGVSAISPPFVPVPKSPSHNITTKHQRIPILKSQLSAPPEIAGPSSPTSPTDSNKSSRQKKFHRHFKNVADDEKVLNYYSCALVADILLQGRLYITNNYFAFYSNVFGYVTKLLIPTVSVLKISKEKTARIIPNAIGIATEDDKHVFGSLLSRDSTHRFMLQVWKAAMSPGPTIPLTIPSILKGEMEDSGGVSGDQQLDIVGEDTSESGSCDLGLEIHTTADTQTDQSYIESLRPSKLSNGKVTTTIQPSTDDIDGYLKQTTVNQGGISSRWIISASVVLLVALSVSALILLVRIGRVEQHLGVKDPSDTSAHQWECIKAAQSGQADHWACIISVFSEALCLEVYEEILKWQTKLHCRSSSKVQEFLAAHLVTLAKVRESLEALYFMVDQEFQRSIITQVNTLREEKQN